MLKELGFSYTVFMIITVSQTVFSLLILSFEGNFSDKFGNYRMILFSSILISAVPFLFLLSGSPYYLIFVVQLVAGIGWTGFNLASGNFIYDLVTPPKRGIAVSYFNLLSGMGTFLGAIVGAVIIQYMSISFMNIFLFIFLVSGIARVLVCIIMLPKMNEIRKVEKFDEKKEIRHFVVELVRNPFIHGITNEIRIIKNHFNYKRKV